MAEHDPLICSTQFDQWDMPGSDCVSPRFAALASTSHWWYLGHGLLFFPKVNTKMINHILSFFHENMFSWNFDQALRVSSR